MATQPLIQVRCVSKGEKIGLTNYSDMVVFDKDHTVVALRIGGYPEAVQAMSDIIIAGCDLELQGAHSTSRPQPKDIAAMSAKSPMTDSTPRKCTTSRTMSPTPS